MPIHKGNVTVRMDAETQKKLDRLAADLARSRNWIINEAVVNYLDVYEWQERKIRDRLDKAEKRGKKFLSSAQVDRAIASFKT